MNCEKEAFSSSIGPHFSTVQRYRKLTIHGTEYVVGVLNQSNTQNNQIKRERHELLGETIRWRLKVRAATNHYLIIGISN